MILPILDQTSRHGAYDLGFLALSTVLVMEPDCGPNKDRGPNSTGFSGFPTCKKLINTPS